MAHTFSNLLYHAIFGVKLRQAILTKPVRDKLFPTHQLAQAGGLRKASTHPTKRTGEPTA